MAKYTHIFEKPWTYENVTYEKMEFDFNKLTGDDLIGIEAEMDAEGNPLVIPEWSSCCKIKLASKASGISDDVLRKLPLRDFKAICGKVNAFLNFGDLADEEAQAPQNG